MEILIESLKSDTAVMISAIFMMILGIAFLLLFIQTTKLNKRYQTFMKKLGNGENIEEDLEKYIYYVENVEKQNAEIVSFCQNIQEEVSGCVQKIGLVRYSAFEDTGSDLSFTLAILDDSNTGIVLNGIYSREMSNIYAKPIENGTSKYTLSQEEKQAIQQAIQSKRTYHIQNNHKDK